tara:strand:+ start:231 stop:368 length:138 start_codon:yes stop_codon:yes gene_type:complete
LYSTEGDFNTPVEYKHLLLLLEKKGWISRWHKRDRQLIRQADRQK